MNRYFVLLLVILIFPYPCAAQQEYRSDINDFVVNEMKLWMKNDIVLKTLRKQNEKHALLSQTDKKILNDLWHGERRKNKKPLMERILENELSKLLKTIKEGSVGLFTEIIIIDAYGLNAGQTMVSQDYWQGGNDKWKNTLGTRSYGTYISELSFDYNTEFFQVEVAFIVTEDDEPVGVIYAGIDIDQIEEWKQKIQE